jgi:hypothetical protein
VRWLLAAATFVWAIPAAAQAPAAELTPLGKRLLEVAVHGQTFSGAPGVLRDFGWRERDETLARPAMPSTEERERGSCGAIWRLAILAATEMSHQAHCTHGPIPV